MSSSTEAEEQIIGICLTDPDLIAFAIDHVRTEDFFGESRRWIWAAMLDLFMDGEDVNQLSVARRLAGQAESTWHPDRPTATRLEITGGQTYLMDCIRNVITVSATGVEFYGADVRRLARLREYVSLGAQMQLACQAEEAIPDEIASRFAAILLDSGNGYSGMETEHIKDVIEGEVAGEVMEWMVEPKQVIGLSTGYDQLDAYLQGLVSTRVIVVSAKSGIGKSLFVQNITDNVASAGAPILVFTTEMSKSEYAKRIVFLRAGVDPVDVMTRESATLRDTELASVHAAVADTGELPIYLCGRGSLTLEQVMAEIRRYKLSQGIKLVVLDHYDMVTTGGRNRNRYEELSTITAGMKRIAQDLDICILVVSHMNREAGKDGKALNNDALRDSSTKEADANQILLLEPIRPKSEKDDNGNVKKVWGPITKEQAATDIRALGYVYMRVIISKNRHGAEGSLFFKVLWRNGGGRMSQISARQEAS